MIPNAINLWIKFSWCFKWVGRHGVSRRWSAEAWLNFEVNYGEKIEYILCPDGTGEVREWGGGGGCKGEGK